MVLSALVFILGFACAAFAAVLLVPLVWRRAARLTRKRLEATLPISINDVRAERDELRAEFSIAERTLERGIDQARQHAAEVRVENGLFAGQIDTLIHDVADRDDKIETFERETAEQSDRISDLEVDLAETESALSTARVDIAGLKLDVEQLTGELQTARTESDTQKVEVIAFKTQSDNLRDNLDERSAALASLEQQFADEQTARRAGAARIATLERTLVSKERELTRQTERVSRLEADQSNVTDRLRKDVEMKARELRDLKSQMTVQVAESSRQGKRAQSLEDQLSRINSELGHVERLLHDTERRATKEIETARKALEAERGRRLELARELAHSTGRSSIEQSALPSVDIRPFETTRGADRNASRPLDRAAVPVNEIKRVKPGPAAEAVAGLSAKLATPAVDLNVDGPSAGHAIQNRIAHLRSTLASDKPKPANGEMATANVDAAEQNLSEVEREKHIHTLASTFSVFEGDVPNSKASSSKNGAVSALSKSSLGKASGRTIDGGKQSLTDRVRSLKERANAS